MTQPVTFPYDEDEDEGEGTTISEERPSRRVSAAARALVVELLEKDPSERLGDDCVGGVRAHAFFNLESGAALDWESALLGELAPPPRELPGVAAEAAAEAEAEAEATGAMATAATASYRSMNSSLSAGGSQPQPQPQPQPRRGSPAQWLQRHS
jgi:hypothetical protein